jgi:hypothetical protein
VVFALRRGGDDILVRPISARYMHDKEVKSYEKESQPLRVMKKQKHLSRQGNRWRRRQRHPHRRRPQPPTRPSLAEDFLCA